MSDRQPLDMGDGIIYATLADISAALSVPARTLQRWAREDRWPKHTLRGTTRYLYASAVRSYTDRGRRRLTRVVPTRTLVT